MKRLNHPGSLLDREAVEQSRDPRQIFVRHDEVDVAADLVWQSACVPEHTPLNALTVEQSVESEQEVAGTAPAARGGA
jgi:hypothetical protein